MVKLKLTKVKELALVEYNTTKGEDEEMEMEKSWSDSGRVVDRVCNRYR